MTSEHDDRAIAEAILDYLAEHPEAMDTPEGIAGWWLERQQVRVSVPAIIRVLRSLTEEGVLEEFGTGATRHYRLRRA
jgi:Fe2+ or Zn2+ uptake regulation protein